LNILELNRILRRWETPLPHQKPFIKDKIINLASTPPACYQNGFSGKMSEFCFYLNIYKPVHIVGLLPVVVWFHGGDGIHGLNRGNSSNIDFGTLSMLANVIVVRNGCLRWI